MRSNLANSQVITFSPTGYVTAANVESFQGKLNREINKQNFSVLLIDMSEVQLLDSSGLMMLVRAFKTVQEMGKRFVICSITDPVRIIFELVRLDEFIEIYQNYREFEDTLLAAA